MTDTIPEWAIDRALQELGVLAVYNNANDVKYWATPPRNNGYARQVLAFARYIAQHEEEPVDPLLIEARECIAKALESDGGARSYVEAIRRGDDDPCWPVQGALRALRRGMELAKERES